MSSSTTSDSHKSSDLDPIFQSSSSDESSLSDLEGSCNGDWRLQDLHAHDCRGSATDLKRMAVKLQYDPTSLNCAQESAGQDHPLHVATYNLHFKCVEFLLDEGANVDSVNYEGLRAFDKLMQRYIQTSEGNGYIALKCKHILKLLMIHGADPNSTDSEVYHLNKIEDLELLKMLLSYGADTEAKGMDVFTSDPTTPLTHALLNRNFEKARLLLLYGAIAPNHMCEIIRHMPSNYHGDNLKLINICREIGVKCSYSLPECSHICLSLLSLSRLAVRKAMGREYKNNIKQLSIPKSLKQYLKFKEIF